MPRCAAQQVTVDCQEHIYRGQVGHRIYRLIESQPRSLADVVPRNRLPLMPACLTVPRQDSVELRGQCWRSDGASQDTKSSPAGPCQSLVLRYPCGAEGLSIARMTPECDGGSPIR